MGETDSNNETGTQTETASCAYECMSETACTKVVGGTVHVELACSNKTDVCCEPPSGKDTNTVIDTNTDADTNTYTDTGTGTGTGTDVHTDSEPGTGTGTDTGTDVHTDSEPGTDTGTGTDTTAPTIVLPTHPVDGATDVPPSSNLVARFDEPVALISGGSVTIRNLSRGSAFDVVISLPSSQVSVSGADLTIKPAADLNFNTDYAVQISADAVEDLFGNPFAGIVNDEDWNFSTPPWPSGTEVTPDHIVSGAVTGTLLAIDVPYVAAIPAAGGPDWPGTADDGFTTVNSPLREEDAHTSNWEPDGTPLSEAKGYRAYGGGNPSVKYVFDLPDDTLISAIYATWNTRMQDGCTYSYTEGLASDSAGTMQNVAPTDDLVLSWTDDVSVVREGNFELLFTGPITVEGGNGFELWAWDNLGNAANVDAIVLDISP